jgi:2-keto-4-pentenoate hydratase/2-oxohepta-3-ene-1,7-dioic acid hydratase in catechol pathway
MKLGRFGYRTEIFYGVIEDNKVYRIKNQYDIFLKENFIKELEICEEYEIHTLKIFHPSVPTKIVAVGLNYRDHAEELNMPIPEEPILFLKPPSAVIGPEETIILPPQSKEVHYEGELAVIMKKFLYRPKSYQEVEKAILGYTCFNDVTARDLQRKDGQWTRAKSFNTFAPFGPFIETEIDPLDLKIQTIVNGEVKQDSSTKELIFNVFELIKFISDIMTLCPGDIIATGTPPGVGPLKDGDVVEVKIECIGTLRNFVKSCER